MTKISEIVSVNSQAVLSNAVQLAWYSDPDQKERNDRLVAGYVFGNGPTRTIGNRTEISSIGAFEKIRLSFGNPSTSNIFTIVAHYGHGKSHFALVLANYFGLDPDSPVLTEILDHIQICSNKVTADEFRNFKKQSKRPQLVLTLAGHQFQDLRQGFLQALRRALDGNETTQGKPIKSIFTRAAGWLKTIKGEQLQKADKYLGQKYRLDVDTLLAGLERFESDKELVAKDLSRELNGIEANFGADVSLKDIIRETVDTFCTGKDAPFHKMLILFDEFGVYSANWCHNPQAAGNLAPQEIFEACLDMPGKLCFVGFVQREMSEFVQDYSTQLQDEFKRWAGRIPPDSIFHLISNLEEVISKLLIKKDKWKNVIQDNAPRILDESRAAWSALPRYRNSWQEQDFYTMVARDCFPLHPLTTGLLCSFDFTQGSRTIIGAVNSIITAAANNKINDRGRLNWIRPIELVSEFETDFRKDSREYSAYDHAINNALSSDSDQILFDVLKALFLYREGMLTKSNGPHETLLAHLAGYPEDETRSALSRLKDDYDAIRFSPQKGEYEFTGVGSSRIVVLEQARREITGKQVDSVTRFLERLDAFNALRLPESEAREFKADFAVTGDEWHLAPRFLDASKVNPEHVKKLCKATADEGYARGTVIYLLSTKTAELNNARLDAKATLEQLKGEDFLHPFVIAIPKEAATQLETQVLLKNYLVNEMSSPQRTSFGESYRAAVEYIERELTDQLISHLRSVDYILPSELVIKLGNGKKSLDEIADILFYEAYKFRPPSNSHLMKTSSTRGNSAVAEIAKQLLIDELNFDGLNQEKQNIVRSVLTTGNDKWGILDAEYCLKKPQNVRVLEAWNFLDHNVSEQEWTSFASILQRLVQPPFGLDDFTATFLITSWIGYHKYELGFKDNRRQPINRPHNGHNVTNLTFSDFQQNLNRAKDFIRWLKSNVSVQHSGRTNVSRAESFLNELRNVKEAADGERLIQLSISILQGLSPEHELVPQIRSAIEEVSEWLAASAAVGQRLNQLRDVARNSNDVSHLIRTIELVKQTGNNDGIQKSKAYVEAAKFVEDRINQVAREQSNVSLQRIESYDSMRMNLEKGRQALNRTGRADLEALFAAALERLDQDYKRIQAEKAEAPLAAEINSMQLNGTTLKNLRIYFERLTEILDQHLSERLSKLATEKREQLDSKISGFYNLLESFTDRVHSVADLPSAEALQHDLLRNEQLFEGSPESTVITTISNILTERIRNLREELIKAQERERVQRQIKLDRETAHKAVKQFEQINDSGQRFDCLIDLLQTAKTLGLSDDQMCKLREILR